MQDDAIRRVQEEEAAQERTQLSEEEKINARIRTAVNRAIALERQQARKVANMKKM